MTAGAMWTPTSVAVRAVVVGLSVSFAGTAVWTVLIGSNLKFAPSVPWGVVAMAVFLCAYWRYLGGAAWPRSTAAYRRACLRAPRLSGTLWMWSITAGTLGVTSAVCLQVAYARLAGIPTAPVPDLSQYPPITVSCALVMSAVVAGLTEEVGFRGYMQVPIERACGPLAASVVVAVVFSLWHLSHGVAYTLPRLPYYFAVSLGYSAIAYLANSLLPVVVIHAGGDCLEFLYVWLRRAPAGHTPPHPPGLDAMFWAQFGLGAMVGLLALGAYRRLAACARAERHAGRAESLGVSTPPRDWKV